MIDSRIVANFPECYKDQLESVILDLKILSTYAIQKADIKDADQSAQWQADLHRCCPLMPQRDFLKTKLKHPLLMCFILVDIQTHLITIYQTLHYLFIFYFHFIFLLFKSNSLKQKVTHASMKILSHTSKDFIVQNFRKSIYRACIQGTKDKDNGIIAV